MSVAKLQVFVWVELFETGVALIDSQHRMLVDLTNQLGAAIERGDVAQGQPVLERLKEYAQYHFETEEAWSIQAGQPPQALAAHQASHAGFLEEVLKFGNGWTSTDDRASALHHFLSAWLIITHILGEDRCRFTFNLSLLNFHLAPTPSICHQIRPSLFVSLALPRSKNYKHCSSESCGAIL